MSLQVAFSYIDTHLDRSFEDLFEYCRLPTVSAHGTAIQETADFTVRLLQSEGFETRVLPKPGGAFPVIYAEQAGANSAKTLLFYNHYDVQPPDPLDEWTSPPFEPVRRGDAIYGRGISDDKGNIVSRMLAIRAMKQAFGGLPCNVKFFIEG